VSQSIEEQGFRIAPIESESHFLKVGGKMLCRDFMPRSNDAPLEQAESGLDAVRGHVAINVDIRAMVDSLVLLYADPSLRQSSGVGSPLVRHNHFYVFADILFDVLGQRSRLHVLSLEESKFAATLFDADNGNLIALAVGDTPRTATMTLLATADKGFVHFERSIHHRLFRRRHRRTDAMAEIPCCLVADSESSLDLVGTHPLAGLAEQVDRREPLDERQVGVVKDRVGRNGKLVVAVFAVEELAAVRKPCRVGSMAARAFRAVRPAKPLQKFPACVVAREGVAKFNDRHRRASNG